VIGLAQFPVVTSTYGAAADALCMLTRSSAREREEGMMDVMARVAGPLRVEKVARFRLVRVLEV
jgi:hypothetical protein